MKSAWLLAGIGVSSLALAAQSPQDYGQWRGQTRDGSASSFVEPARWPDALTRRWTAAVGEGYATPLIVGGVVYAFTRQQESEVLTALDARSGAERWHTAYPAPYSPSQQAEVHGAWPKATPLFYRDRIFTVGIAGIVSAFDASGGKLIWQSAAPAEQPFYGAASSPLAEDGLVITHPGNYGPLTAFDAVTGRIKWTAGTGGFFSSPIAITLNGTRQVVTATQDAVIGVSLGGVVLWRQPWDGRSGSTTPVQSGGLIIVSTPGSVAGLEPSVRDGAWAVRTVWTAGSVGMYLSSPVVVDDTLYGLSNRSRGQLFAMDARSGSVRWLGPPRAAENAAVVKGGNILFFLNDDGHLVVAKANRDRLEPLARYTVAGSSTWAQPAISGNRIFVKDATTITLWTVD